MTPFEGYYIAKGEFETRHGFPFAWIVAKGTRRESALHAHLRAKAAQRMSALGLNLSEIARHLGVNSQTVRHYLGKERGGPKPSPSCQPSGHVGVD